MKESVQKDFGDLMASLNDFFRNIIDLKKGVDPPATIKEIREKKSLAGANSWMLMCSIMIASIGLSQNSQAVIIGAMLISPLMSPILGIGLSIGINDTNTLRKSFLHFAVAIAIALITSSLYFYLSPFDAMTAEIESRTKPTFLDIIIAVFGGVAGIISLARKDISTTMPGVAIATALMPPLCVAGFGISHGDWETASKSFYLFFLNSFFVALATFVIVRYLRFPMTKYIDKKTKRKNLILMSVFGLALVIPSFFIFRSVIEDLQTNIGLKRFEKECLGEKNIFLDGYNLARKKDGSAILYLKVYGISIDESMKPQLTECLNQLNIKNCDIQIISSSDVDITQVKKIESELSRLVNEMNTQAIKKIQQNELMSYYQSSIIDSSLFNQLSKELKILYPKILELGLAEMDYTDFDSTQYNVPVILIDWGRERASVTKKNNQQIRSFLVTRMNKDTVLVLNK